MSDVHNRIDTLVKGNKVVLFMKGSPEMPQCGFSARAATILAHLGASEFAHVDVLSDPEVRQGIKDYSNWPTIPALHQWRVCGRLRHHDGEYPKRQVSSTAPGLRP